MNEELSCIMEHVNIDTEATEESPRGFRVGTTEVHFSSLGTDRPEEVD